MNTPVGFATVMLLRWYSQVFPVLRLGPGRQPSPVSHPNSPKSPTVFLTCEKPSFQSIYLYPTSPAISHITDAVSVNLRAFWIVRGNADKRMGDVVVSREDGIYLKRI